MSPHFTKTKIPEIIKPATRWAIGDKFKSRMPHHEGIKALWETKWKLPVSPSYIVGILLLKLVMRSTLLARITSRQLPRMLIANY